MNTKPDNKFLIKIQKISNYIMYSQARHTKKELINSLIKPKKN